MRKVMLLLVVLLALGGCEKPGEGAQAQAGYDAAQPVIAGLESYRQKQGSYPGELAALVPGYLDSLPGGPGGPFEYRLAKDGPGYELTFRYAGPGMNICTYRPDSAWRCFGYY